MRQVRTYLTAGTVLALAGTASLACSPVAQTSRGVSRGDQCQVNYYSPQGGVFSGQALRVSATTVRQTINTGTGCGGEQIVVYYDCASKQAVWMGGGFDMMGAFSPTGNAMTSNEKGEVLVAMSAGPADWFMQNLEAEFAPDYAVAAMTRRLPELDWMPQSGVLTSSTISVEGKRFNLACGCDLPQTGGN